MIDLPDSIRVIETLGGIPVIIKNTPGDNRGVLFIKESAIREGLKQAYAEGVKHSKYVTDF